MKVKFLKFFLSALVLLLVCTNCDYLESEEYLVKVDDLNNIYKNRVNVRRSLAACFEAIQRRAALGNIHETSFDEIYAGREDVPGVAFGQGKNTAENLLTENYWAKYYKAIRICNLFLENAPNADLRDFGENELEHYLADARFLRAYYHFLIARDYGPIVVLDHSVDYSTGEYPVIRKPFDQGTQWICDELDAVIKLLPSKEDQINEYVGLPTKELAMMVKADLLLFKASPLVNGNADYASFTNFQGETLISQTYDVEKWRDAANAFKDIIDLNVFDIYTVESNDGYVTVPLGEFEGNDVAWPDGPANIDPYRSYKSLFDGGPWLNSEMIFQWNFYNNGLTRIGWPRGANKGNGWAHAINATQEVVDAYLMNNGKTITEENNNLYNDMGFALDADNFYIKGEESALKLPIQTNFKNGGNNVPNRVLNREARFYATIGFNGRGWPMSSQSEPWHYADFRLGGDDGYVKTSQPSCLTGYPIVKWVNNEDSRVEGDFRKQLPLYRYAEVCLGYAEALNEVEPGHPDIKLYFNKVRFRAGLPGSQATTQEEMRTEIKRERQVEFAFEFKRYHDMRRWKDATSFERDMWNNGLGLGGPVVGCDYLSSSTSFFNRTAHDGYLFREKNYWLPLSFYDINNHWGALVQNPGY